MMEYAEDEELRADDFNKFACEHRKAIGKVEKKALTTVKYVKNEELSPVNFNRVISEHIKDVVNLKDVVTKSNGE